MQKLVKANNKSKLSDSVIISVAWKESNFKPAATVNGSSATGLMMVTRGAASDAGYPFSQMTDPATNIAAGSAYLQMRINWSGGNVLSGLNGYGTGSGYGDNILRAASLLDAGAENPMEVLQNEIHH